MLVTRLTACVNTVLDWAGRRGRRFPFVAGFCVGGGIEAVAQGSAWGWALIGAGLILAAIRPLGTSQRNRHRLREARRLLREARAGDVLSGIAAVTKLDQVERSLGIRRDDPDA